MGKLLVKKTFQGRAPGSTDRIVNQFLKEIGPDNYVSHDYAYAPDTGEIYSVLYFAQEVEGNASHESTDANTEG